MKHQSIGDRSKAKIQATSIHRGAFSSGFSKAFDISGLQVILETGEKFDVDDLIKIAIDYWLSNLLPEHL